MNFLVEIFSDSFAWKEEEILLRYHEIRQKYQAWSFLQELSLLF